MSPILKSQISAIIGLILLATIAIAPWLAESYWLTPQTKKWADIINHKNQLVTQMMGIDKEVTQFNNIAEKQAANVAFRKNISSATIDGIQGFVNSNPKYQVNFKIAQAPDTHDIRITVQANYNLFGALLSDLWNNYQFVEINSMVIKPSLTRSEEEVTATISVRLPQSQ